jgi:hypothetical protein
MKVTVITLVTLLGLQVGCSSDKDKYDQQRMDIEKQEAHDAIDNLDLEKGDELEVDDEAFGNKTIKIDED